MDIINSKNDKIQLATFVVDKLLFGINVMHVQEVINYEEPTMVPLAPYEVAGLINLRGVIVTAIDIKKLLEINDETLCSDPKIVIVNYANEKIGLIVDQIKDVVEVDYNTKENVPASLTGNLKKILNAIYKLDKLLLEVKLDALLT
jgi:purine-binding chemotaxis protein CheW